MVTEHPKMLKIVALKSSFLHSNRYIEQVYILQKKNKRSPLHFYRNPFFLITKPGIKYPLIMVYRLFYFYPMFNNVLLYP